MLGAHKGIKNFTPFCDTPYNERWASEMFDTERLIDDFANGTLRDLRESGNLPFDDHALAAGLYALKNRLTADRLIKEIGNPIKCVGDARKGSLLYVLQGDLVKGHYIMFDIEDYRVVRFGTNSTGIRDLKIENYRNGKPKYSKSHQSMKPYSTEMFFPAGI